MNRSFLKVSAAFILMAFVVYMLRTPISDVYAARSQLSRIPLHWYFIVLFFESVSFVCVWVMFRSLLPNISWRTNAFSQLISNASSRAIPGGAATGGAVQFRMLSAGGAKASEAAGALAASSVLTLLVLLIIPAVAGLVAVLNASIEGSLAWAVVLGPLMFSVLALLIFAVVRLDRPLLLLGRWVDKVFSAGAGLLNKSWLKDQRRLVNERNRLVSVLGKRWKVAVAAAAGKWFFDFLGLLFIIRAAGASPNFSLVLLAYAGASVLAMVPITPGGFGLVEVGLQQMLIKAGLQQDDASLSVLVYRIVSFWFPLAVGFVAWIIHRYFKSVDSQRGQSVDVASKIG